MQDSGEGRWTVTAALEEAVPADVLTAALYTRFRSRQEHTFAEKMLSAMRQKFGGHIELTTKERKSFLIRRSRHYMPQLERELPALEQPPSGSPPPTGPCVMVIFGGTGDLTARKLFPALYNLVKSKLLPSDFAIVGVGRNDYTAEQYQQDHGR